jgi:hypothetical protein
VSSKKHGDGQWSKEELISEVRSWVDAQRISGKRGIEIARMLSLTLEGLQNLMVGMKTSTMSRKTRVLIELYVGIPTKAWGRRVVRPREVIYGAQEKAA